MNGKKLLLKALKGGETPRPAWLPFVGVHGAKLIGCTAEEYLKSSSLLVEGLLKAYELYKPDGLPIVFDLQVEAEVLGCDLRWADEVPPAVVGHPLAEGKSLAALPELSATSGRFPLIIEALKEIKQKLGDEIALYGLICGPFTLALHLLGNDIFLEMYDDPDRVGEIVDFAADVAIAAADIYLANGADVIALVDPMTSQISPDHFEEFVTPYLNKVFAHIRQRGGLSSIFVCGDVTRNLTAMCQTEADNISVDEQISIPQLRDLALKNGKSFGGNIKLTTVLLLGDENTAKCEALRLIDEGGSKGFILAPGCDLPYGVPEANLRAVSLMIHDDYAREVARTALVGREAMVVADIELPDYQAAREVIVDVITLDSEACAPCQYMMMAAMKAASLIKVPILIKEHKIKNHQGIAMMVKLGVANLPTICIDGQIKFISIIPDQNTLAAELTAAARNKGLL